MRDAEPLFTLKNRWFAWSVGGVIAMAVVSILVGFLWMPSVQRGAALGGVWEAICSAAGAPGQQYGPEQANAQTVSASDVIVVPDMIVADNLSIGRGATLSLRCSMCHGARGMSGANIPNLAGQNAAFLYKQLRDLQSAHRQSSIMAPHAANLSDQDMRDLAVYYAYLPRMTPPPAATVPPVPKLVEIGAPMRNIAPCASCHVAGRKTASPVLDGEPHAYILAQLQAFGRGTRHNDINGQMRNVARQMTPQEIQAVAAYYAAR